MPNVGQVLKQEVMRLSGKVARQATAVLRKDTTALKHATAELKRRCGALEKQIKQMTKAMPKPEDSIDSASPVTADDVGKSRPTSKMVRALRTKLGISQREFAQLLGVSTNSVNLWEHKPGRLVLRERTKVELMKLRQMGKRAVKAAIAAQPETPSEPAPRKARKPRKNRAQKTGRRARS